MAINKNSFLRNVITLVGSGVAAQVLAVLLAPILTRLYSPNDFGVLAIYVSVALVLTNVSSFRYELAIPLAESENSAKHLVFLCFALIALNAAVVAIAILFGPLLVSSVPVWALIEHVIWLIPLTMVGAGGYQVLTYWAIREKIFQDIAKTKVTQTVGMLGIQVGFGILGVGQLALMLGDLFGKAAGVFLLFWRFVQHFRNEFFAISLGELRNVVVRFKSFPLMATWSTLLNSLGLYIAPIMLGLFYGAETAGLFALGQRIMGMPVTLISQSISQAYYSEAIAALKQGSGILHKLYISTLTRLFLIGAPIISLIGLASPYVFPRVFGVEWASAGFYSQILVIYFVAYMSVSPLSQTLNILENQRVQFVWDLARVVTLFVGLGYLGLNQRPAYEAILAFCLIMAFYYCVHAIATSRLIRKHLPQEPVIG